MAMMMVMMVMTFAMIVHAAQVLMDFGLKNVPEGQQVV